MNPAHANREVYQLLKEGVKVTYRDIEGVDTTETVRIIDWDNPLYNDFFLASQFWISGDLYKRRPDLVGFVNGIPLLLIELKASHKNLIDTYNNNLRPDLLILDDFGLKPIQPPGPEDLYDVINERYERGSILLTSNRAPNEWPDLFLDPLLASAGLDRLLDRAEVVIIRGASYRAQGRTRLTEEVPTAQKQP